MAKSPDELRTLLTLIKIGKKGRCAYVGLQKKMLKTNPGRKDLWQVIFVLVLVFTYVNK